MDNLPLMSSPTRLGYLRCASTGAFSTLILYVLCWIGVLIGTPVVFSHAFMSLFTTVPMGSMQSLVIGGLTAFAVGGIAGAIIAHCYNLAGRIFGD